MCLKQQKERDNLKNFANYKFCSLWIVNYDFTNSHWLIKKIRFALSSKNYCSLIVALTFAPRSTQRSTWYFKINKMSLSLPSAVSFAFTEYCNVVLNHVRTHQHILYFINSNLDCRLQCISYLVSCVFIRITAAQVKLTNSLLSHPLIQVSINQTIFIYLLI